MKKRFIVLMVCLLAASCQKQQEPKPQYQFPTGQAPAGQLQAQDEMKLLNDVVTKDPKNVEAWIKLGNIMMDSSRFQEAIDAYQKALELDPKNVDVRVDMGTCYRNNRNSDLAAKEYRKALEINPNHLLGRRNLGIVLAYDLRDTAQAIKEFEKLAPLLQNAQEAEQLKQEIQKLKSGK